MFIAGRLCSREKPLVFVVIASLIVLAGHNSAVEV